MAVTVSLYNHSVKKFANKEFTFTTLKFMLLDNTASFNATHTTLEDVAGAANAKEVDGNGWDTGGELLANVTVSVTGTNDAKLDADDISVTATGGPIGPAYAAVLYDDTGDVPIAYVDFGTDEQAGQDTDFKVVWNSNGIVTWTYA